MDLPQFDLLLAGLRREPHAPAVLAAVQRTRPPKGAPPADWVRRVEVARARHEARGEYAAAATLLECETRIVVDDPPFVAGLLRELARVAHEELLDDVRAVAALERALALDASTEASAELEHLKHTEARWAQVAARFEEEAESASEPSLRASLLTRAASLVWQHGGRGRETRSESLFERALAAHPGALHVARAFAVTLRAREEWEMLGDVCARSARHATTPDAQAGLLAQAAEAYEKTPRGKSAARRVLEELGALDASDERAVAALAERLTEEERWEDLIGLYDRVLRAQPLPVVERGTLLQAAMIEWHMRGAPERAEGYFARLARLEPAHPAVLDFARQELFDRGRDRDRALAILADAVRAVSERDAVRVLLSELARRTEAAHGAGDRVVELWKAALRADPTDEEARAALRRIYESTERWNALVDLLQHELDRVPDGDPRVRESLLREIHGIYRDRLGLPPMVISTARLVLDVAPGDVGLLRETIEVAEAAGRAADANELRGRWLALGPDRETASELLRSIARTAIEKLHHPQQATEALEQLLDADPSDRYALSELRRIYEQKRDWKRLGAVLDREMRLASDPAVRLADQVRLAEIKADHLHAPGEAMALLKEIAEHAPETPGVLHRLERLASREKDPVMLAFVVERAISVEKDPRARAQRLRRLATLYREDLKDPARAAEVLEVLAAAEPGNSRTFRLLRDVLVDRGDWDELERVSRREGDLEAFVDALGAAVEGSNDAAWRAAQSLRLARICRDELARPDRALRHYERVLLAEGDNEEAARALLPRYEREENWARLAHVKAVLLRHAGAEPEEHRARLAEELADLAADRLGDPARALEWGLGALELGASSPGLLDKLERYARAADAVVRLVAGLRTLESRLPAVERPPVLLRLARLEADDLGEPDAARAHLEAARALAPGDRALTESLRQAYRAQGAWKELRALLLEEERGEADPTQLRRLRLERALLEEDRLGEGALAAATYEQLLELDPSDDESLASLERIYDALGAHAKLAETLRRRAALADPQKRIDVLLRLGAVQCDGLADLDAALDTYAEVLERSGGDERATDRVSLIAQAFADHAPRAERMLEAAYEARASHASLRQVLERRVRAASDEQERGELEGKLVELLADRIGDTGEAFARARAAAERRPGDSEAWDRVERLAARREEPLLALEAYGKALQARGLTPEAEGWLASRAVAWADAQGLAADAAEPFLRRRWALDAGALDAFARLREFYTDAARWRDLEALFASRIERETDPANQVEALLESAFVFEEVLEDVQNALLAHERVAQIEPANAAAHSARARLYRRLQRWPELIALLDADWSVAAGATRAQLGVTLAELVRRRQQDPARALAYLEDALAADPSRTDARGALGLLLEHPELKGRAARALAPVHLAEREWAAFARAQRVIVDLTEERSEKAAALRVLLTVVLDEIHDLPAAFDLARELVLLSPEDAGARATLARIASRRGTEPLRAEVLEAALASGTDAATERALLEELAELWEARIQDSTRAVQAYRRLLALADAAGETRLGWLRAATRLLAGPAVQGGAPARELAGYLEEEASLERDGERQADVLVRLAALREQALRDRRGALAALDQALAKDPEREDAAHAVLRLAEGAPDGALLLRAHGALLAAAKGPREREAAAVERGRVRAEVLGDPAAAHKELAAFAASEPVTATTHRLLAAFAEQAGDAKALVEALTALLTSTPEGDERNQVRVRLASVLGERLDRRADALRLLEAAFETPPRSARLLDALVGLLVVDDTVASRAGVLVAHELERSGRTEDAVRALDRAAGHADANVAADALLKAAELLRSKVGDAPAAVERLAAAATRAPARRLQEVFDVLLTLAEPALAPRRAEALRFVAERAESEDLRRSAALEAARALDQAADPDGAAAVLEKLLERDPQQADALARLEAHYTAKGAWEALAATLEKRLAAPGDQATRVATALRLAALHEHEIEDVDRAVAAYDRLRALGEPRLRLAHLERLFEREERWGELHKLYREELARDGGDHAELHHRLGLLAKGRMGDPSQAIAHFREVLTHRADHAATAAALEEMLREGTFRAEAAELLEPYFLKRLEWKKLVAVLDAQLDAAPDAASAKRIALRRAQIIEEYLEDLDLAFDAYSALFAEDPWDRAVREAFDRLARVMGREVDVARAYWDVVERTAEDSAEVVALARRAGERLLAHAETRDAGVAALERVVRYDFDDAEALEWLEAGYRAAGATSKLLALYRERADRAASDGRALELLRTRADLLASSGGAAEAVVQAWLDVLELAPDDAQALDAIEALLLAAADHRGLYEHLERRLDLVLGSPEEWDLRARMATLLLEALGRPADAFAAFADVLAAVPGHAPTLAVLEAAIRGEQHRGAIAAVLAPAYRATGQWKKLVVVLEARAALTEAPEERVPLLQEIAELHETRGSDLSLALDAWTRAFVEAPTDSVLRAQVERLARRLEAWDVLVRTFEHAAGQTTDVDARVELLVAIGGIESGLRGHDQAAIDVLEVAARLRPMDRELLERLDDLYTKAGDARGLDDVLGREAALAEGDTAAAFHRRRAVLRRDALRSPPAAMESFEDALRVSPDDAEALAGLDAMLRDAGLAARRAEVLARRADVEGGEVRPVLLLECARVLADELARPDDAIEVLERLLAEEPGRPDALTARQALAERLERWADAIEVLERRMASTDDAAVRAGFAHHAGVLARQRLAAPSDAVRWFATALGDAPGQRDTVDALVDMVVSGEARPEAVTVVVPELERAGRADDLVRVLEASIEDAATGAERSALWSRIADVHRVARGDGASAFGAWLRAAAETPEDDAVAAGVEQSAEAASAWDRAVDAFEAMASSSRDREAQIRRWVRAAQLAEGRLQDTARAIRGWRVLLGLDAEVDMALAELDRLHEARGEVDPLREVLLLRIPRAGSVADRVVLRVRLGELEFGRPEGVPLALEAFAEALGEDPREPTARARLVALLVDAALADRAEQALHAAYTRLEEHQLLAELAEYAAGRAVDRHSRAERLREAAAHWKAAGAGHEAHVLASLRAAWIADPFAEGLLADWLAVVSQTGAVDALRGAAEVAVAHPDLAAGDRVSLLLLGARWYSDRLQDLETALLRVRDALAIEPRTSAAHAHTVELLAALRRPTEEAAALDAWLAHAPEGDDGEGRARTVTRLVRLAELSEHALGDLARARAALEAAVQVAPAEAPLHGQLLRVITRLEDWAATVPVLEVLITLNGDPTARGALAVTLAETHEHRLGDPVRAAEAYERAHADLPGDLGILRALERLYVGLGRTGDLLRVLDAALAVGVEPAEQVRLLVAKAGALRAAGGDLAEARAAVEAARRLAPQDEGVLDELGAVLLAQGDHTSALALFEERLVGVRMREDVGREVRLLYAIAAAAIALDSLERARVAYARILTVDSREAVAARALVELARSGTVRVDLLDALERLLQAETGAAKATVALEVAALARARGDAGRAARALGVAYDADPADRALRTALEAELREAHDHAALARLKFTDARLEADPVKRVEGVLAAAGIAMGEAGAPALAVELLGVALGADPTDRRLLAALGHAQVAAGATAEAVGTFERLVASHGGKRSKDLGAAYHGLGVAQAAAGDAEGALRSLEAASKFDLTSVPILRDLGRVAYDRGDYERAQKAFRALLLQRLDEKSAIRKADVYCWLGDIAAREGDKRRAVMMLERALVEDRGHPGATALLQSVKSSS